MRADVLAGVNRGTRGRRRAAFRLVNAAERQVAKHRQRTDGEARAIEERTAINALA